MRMRLTILMLLAGLLFACSQGAGEVCQNDSDCDDGLVCAQEADERGFCQHPKDVMAPAPEDKDSGPEPLNPDPDASIDAGMDASSASDDDAG
jgi:hypothetical protein